MIIYIKQHDLLDAVSKANSIIDKKPLNETLKNIHLSFSSNTMVLTAINQELELNLSKACEYSGDDISICVDSHKLAEISRANSDLESMVELTINNDHLHIKDALGVFKLQIFDASYYPKLTQFVADNENKISANFLLKSMGKTSFSMAKNDVRYFLNGCYMRFNDQLTTVSTDGHRLSLYSDAISASSGSEYDIILPSRTVNELSRLYKVDQQDFDIDVAVSQHHIKFTTNETTLISKLIDGKYPDFSSAVPALNLCHQYQLSRSQLIQAIQRAAIFCDENIKSVELDYDAAKQIMNISADTKDSENSNTAIEMKHAADQGFKTFFNFQYLLEALNPIDDDDVMLAMTDDFKTLMMMPADNDKQKYVIKSIIR